MCYDLSFSSSIESIYDYLPELDKMEQLDFEFGPDIHALAQSYLKWPIITNEGGKLQLKRFEWGVIAHYMKTPEKIKESRPWMCNITSEKILKPGSFWHTIRANRCLIPATGFYEPHKEDGIKDSFWFYIQRPDRPMFFLPGLFYYPLHRPDVETGEVTGTFGLITRPANEVMAAIHNGKREEGHFRMPLMLPIELEKEWLAPSLDDVGIKQILDYRISSNEIAYRLIDSPRKRGKPNDESILESIIDDRVKLKIA